MNWQLLIVSLIVLGAVGYCARLAYRTFQGKSTGCHCGTECAAHKQTAHND